jgi:tetratricopeptide (TPR) repeat protein
MNNLKAFAVMSCFIFFGTTLFAQDEDSVAIYEMYGLAEKGDYNKALKKANDYLAVRKSDEVFLFKSNMLNELKRFPESIENFEKGLQLFPQSFLLHFQYGIFLNLLTENGKAVDHLTTSYELANDSIEKSLALTARAATYSSFREFTDAYEDLINALEFDPNNVATLVNLGAVCDELDKRDEGIKFLTKAVELAPDFSGGYANLGYLYQQKGDFLKAIDYYNKVIDLDPNEALGYSNRSYNYLMIGETKQAMKDINKSLQLFSTNSYAHMVKALILIENKKISEACESLNIAIHYGFTDQYGSRVNELLKEYCR